MKSDSCKRVNKKENRLEYIISQDIGIKINLEDVYRTRTNHYYNIPRQTLQNISDHYDVAVTEKRANELLANAKLLNRRTGGDVGVTDYISNNNICGQVVKREALEAVSKEEKLKEEEAIKRSIAREEKKNQLKLIMQQSTVEEPLKSYIKRLKSNNLKLVRALSKKASQCSRLKWCKSLLLETANRYTISSSRWHRLHPDACNFYFGYQTWKELKVYLRIFCRNIRSFSTCVSAKLRCDRTSYQPFEKCLMWLMRNRTGAELQFIAGIFGIKSIKSVSRYIIEVSPYFSTAGLELSKLDITDQYLRDETPVTYKSSSLPLIGGLIDAKDFMIEQPRNSGIGRRHSFSDKVHHAAFRSLPLTTKSGLVVDHSYPVLGACSESNLLKQMGREKQDYCPFD